jgi:hypothetical protein
MIIIIVKTYKLIFKPTLKLRPLLLLVLQQKSLSNILSADAKTFILF